MPNDADSGAIKTCSATNSPGTTTQGCATKKVITLKWDKNETWCSEGGPISGTTVNYSNGARRRVLTSSSRVVREPLHNRVRYVPQAGGWRSRQNRRYGGFSWRRFVFAWNWLLARADPLVHASVWHFRDGVPDRVWDQTLLHQRIATSNRFGRPSGSRMGTLRMLIVMCAPARQ